MRGRSVIPAVLMGAMASACVGQHYVLPVADGGVIPSPPSLQGRIASVGAQGINVTPSGADPIGSSSIAVHLGRDTQIFTINGGRVATSELVVGQRVRIWFRKPGLPASDQTPDAAVVVLASKDPNDDWPR